MQIVIPGAPIAKARPRFVCRGKHTMAYDSQSDIVKKSKKDMNFIIEDYFKLNDHQISSFKGSFRGQKQVTICFHVPIAVSDSEARKNEKRWGLIWESKKDLDNYIKFYFDIANGLLWYDDSQIVDVRAVQLYSESPCTIITVEDIKMHLNDDATKMTHIFSPAALNKFESDVSMLRVSLESLRLCQREERDQYLDAVAGSLKDFATTYGLALKKMAAK